MQVEDEILQRLEKSGKGKVSISPGGNIEHIQLNTTDPWTEADGERSRLGTKFHRTINAHHRSLVAAIETGDEDAAGGEMHVHVEYLRPFYEKAWRGLRARG